MLLHVVFSTVKENCALIAGLVLSCSTCCVVASLGCTWFRCHTICVMFSGVGGKKN
jgi:hypothetical protein